jgi:hypothetical protein
MPPKPLPSDLVKPLHSPEALRDLADKVGQFEDDKNFERLRRERPGLNQQR